MPTFLGYPKVQYFDNNGSPLSGGLVYTYDAGASQSPANERFTYGSIEDALAETNPLSNPVVLDSRGEATIVINGGTLIVLKDSDDTLIWSVDHFDQNVNALTEDESGVHITPSSGTIALAANTSVTGTLTVSGAISSTAGNITSGSSGDAGKFISYPSTSTNGTFIFEALNAGGAYDTTLRNSAMGQSSVISIPDPGASTANVLLDTGSANLLSVQQFLGLNSVLTFGTGTWTNFRPSQGIYSKAHTPANETSIIAIDITPEISTTSSKGFRLNSFDVIYAINTAAMDSHTATLDRIAYADTSVTVSSIGISGSLEINSRASVYLSSFTVSSPAFDNTDGSKYILEITANNSATSAYNFYGVIIRYSRTIK